jgi:hypothetical protein
MSSEKEQLPQWCEEREGSQKQEESCFAIRISGFLRDPCAFAFPDFDPGSSELK